MVADTNYLDPSAQFGWDWLCLRLGLSWIKNPNYFINYFIKLVLFVGLLRLASWLRQKQTNTDIRATSGARPPPKLNPFKSKPWVWGVRKVVNLDF